MEKEKPLTIDAGATKEHIKLDGRTPMSWSRLRNVAAGTMQRIMNGSYPHTDGPNSEYQRILRLLQADRYLVELGCQVEAGSDGDTEQAA